MPRRSVRITPTGGGRIPPLFSPAMDNSGAANPNRRGRSPSPRKGSPRGKSSRRRLHLDPTGSPNQSNDGSGARTPRTGGGGRRPNVEDQPNEDGSDNNVNSDEFIDLLKAHEDPMMLRFAEYLSAKDKAISDLQQQVQFEQEKRKTQEAIRDYDDTGRSSFYFHPEDIGDLLHTFIIMIALETSAPNIR